jgi:hypothetical protein
MSASTSAFHAASLRRVPAIVVAALLLQGIAAARRVHETSAEFHFTGAVSLGRAIEIKGMIGDVVAEPSSSGEVEVVALKKSPTGDLGRVRLRVIHHDGGTTVCAVYPNPNFGGDCTPGDEASSQGAASDVEVSFRVRVPAGVRFVGRTSNGKVAASRLRGDVEAHTVNGNIDIHTSGEARAFTVNGSITAQLDSRAAAASLQTINGNVTVKVSPAAGARLDATTVNGAIRASVPIFSTDDSGNHFSGVLGRGGSRVDLRTVNGDIFLQPMHGIQVIYR